jgi:hypothetical protein
MSARTALISHAQGRTLADLPQAREILRPELLAGSSGTPLEWARLFHRSFFDAADTAIEARCLLVLPDVVIGHAGPLLREVQLWAATYEPEALIRLSSTDIARQFGSVPGVHTTICTAEALFLPVFESCPYLDDIDLRCSMSASLCMSTTVMLASLAPYVRVRSAVVRAYRPSNVLRHLIRRRPRDQGSS